MEKFYYPILKWKQGEKDALGNLGADQRASIVPILEIVDFSNTEDFFNELKLCFDDEVFVDTRFLEEGEGEYLELLINSAEKTTQKIYPVLYFDTFLDLANSLEKVVNRLAIKIPVPEDIENDGPTYETTFEAISSVKLSEGTQLDIILDLGNLSNNINSQYAELKNVLNSYIKNNIQITNIIIASTAFPTDLSSLEAGKSIFVERKDKKLFEKILSNTDFYELKDRLYYSDYGVTRFTETEIDFTKLRYGILPKARYTTANQYWVLKGKKNQATKKWIKSHQTLAEEILNSPHYYGAHFSFGDLDIKKRALKIDGKGPGNNTSWVTIAANHHISVVIEELSKKYGSLVVDE